MLLAKDRLDVSQMCKLQSMSYLNSGCWAEKGRKVRVEQRIQELGGVEEEKSKGFVLLTGKQAQRIWNSEKNALTKSRQIPKHGHSVQLRNLAHPDVSVIGCASITYPAVRIYWYIAFSR